MQGTHKPKNESIINWMNRFFFFLVNCKGKNGQVFKSTWENNRFEYQPIADQEFSKLFMNYELEDKANPKKRKKDTPSIIWMKSQKRKWFNSIIFNPSLPPDKHRDIVNEWRGFEFGNCTVAGTMEPLSEADRLEVANDLVLVKAHFEEILFRGAPELYEYAWNWLAHVFQIPESPTGVALLNEGEMGAGKTFWWEYLCKALPFHLRYLSQSQDLTHKFGGHLLAKVVLLAADEVDLSDEQKMNYFKTMVTGTTRREEQKNMQIVQQDNYVNFVLTTNKPNCLRTERGDMRRFFWVKCSSKRRGDKDYFAALKRAMTRFDRAAMKLLFIELMKRDLTNFDPATKPVTEEMINLQTAQLSPFNIWWLSCIRNCNLGLGTSVDWKEGPMVNLEQFFQCFSLKDKKTTLAEFVTNLKDVLPFYEIPDKKAENLSLENPEFRMAPFSSCRKHANKLFRLGDKAQSGVVTNEKKRKKTTDQRKKEKARKKKKQEDSKQTTLNKYLKGKDEEPNDFPEVQTERGPMDFAQALSPILDFPGLSLGRSPGDGSVSPPICPFDSDEGSPDNSPDNGDYSWLIQ